MVHIKKVEIFGFKSFGFKNTVVPFEPGLVSISGPNGSGKSNILDAIIFALGENKPKIMRVDKLRSLLHDIEGTRRGAKLARASVHFDNSDRKIPVDSDNVEVTREMDDKGENIYYLNKKKTNRNQILELMEVANAGLNQLNAVQQGTVTRISEFSSEEKRASIEDLIGLSYFDDKKSEAVKQLEEADRRLEIALAKMGEIKKRIDELEEERNQKLRYDMIEREVNKYNAIDAANKLKTIIVEKTSKDRSFHAIASEIKKFEEERITLRKEIHVVDSQKSEFMEKVNAYNQAKSTIDSELSTAMKSFEETSSAILASQKRLDFINTRIPEILQTIETSQQQRNLIESQISEIKQLMQKTTQEKKNLTDTLHSLDSERAKVLSQQSKAAAQKLEVDNKIKKLNSKLNEAKLLLSELLSEQKAIDNKINNNTAKLDEYKLQNEKLHSLKVRLESMKNNHKATVVEIKNRIGKLNSRKLKIEKDLEELNNILEKSSKAANQYESKIKTVKGIMHEDYSISKLIDDAEKLGIDGLVYKLISWDKQYERAMLATASDWIKAFVVKDFATLISLVEVARSKNLPKLKIIPLEAIPNFKLDIRNEKGVIGVLSDYAKCNPKYAPLKTFLFGNIVLTNSKESAYQISQSGYKAVTLDGEFFEAKSSAVIVDINSKISKLTKIISMSSSVEGLQQAISLLKKATLKRKNNLKKIDSSIDSYRNRLSLSEKDLVTTEQSYSDLKIKIPDVVKISTQLANRISQLKRRKDHLKSELAKQESLVTSLNDRITLVDENYSSGEQTRIATELTRLNEKKTELERKQTDVLTKFREESEQIATLNANITKEKTEMKNLTNERVSLNSEKHEHEQKIRGLEKEKEKHSENLITLRGKEQELISTSGTSVSQLKEYDDKLKTLHDKDRHLTKEINLLDRQSDALSRDLKELTENETKIQKLLTSYGFDENIETFDVSPILSALFAEQRSLTALNAKSPETYLEISSGYRSMSTRKNSLEEERNSIVKFIEDIEKDKRQTFLDAFDKVDKEIRSIFTKMTGGNAWLELENEDDIFNSGISYLIQFPNKPKRASTSISGGEKTLAAIVFVLALQKLKPSPFYLFDEVDAHLDAPNSERLSKILEERSQESQFIMVSLKDSVVQKAKLIYGVFPKNGVSNVVTYKDKRLPSMAP